MSELPKSFSFTKERIDSLPLPPIKTRVTYHDTHKLSSGLQLRITTTGAKSFSVFKRINGSKPERITFGRYPEMTIEQARKNAAKINVAVADGDNPAEVKRAHKAEITFTEFFNQYTETYAKHRKKTWEEDLPRYRIYIETPLGAKKVSAIDRATIIELHRKISRTGHGTVANRVLALISSIFSWGVDACLVESNPAKGIKKNTEVSRDRFLQSEEIPKFFAALAEEDNPTMKDFIILSLLTGARKSNMLSMHYKDISFEREQWRIEDTKNGTPQNVTLSPEAIEILRNRLLINSGGFVFPGDGITGHMVAPYKGWVRLCKRAGFENLRLHDLRRTLGSWQAITGSSLLVIGKSLNHLDIKSTAIYSRLSLDPVRASVNTATTAMMDAAKAGSIKIEESKAPPTIAIESK
jgi:integrase